MQAVVGMVIALIGTFMSVFSCFVMQSDVTHRRYSYSPPFSDHETTMLMIMIIGVIAIVVGISVIIFAIVKQKSKEKIDRLKNTDVNGLSKSSCSKCGLNLAPNTKKCPRCGNIINKGE